LHIHSKTKEGVKFEWRRNNGDYAVTQQLLWRFSMKKAIIIGASSGIGKELAKLLSKDNITLGLTGRRVELLEELKSLLPCNAIVKHMDITDCEASKKQLDSLIFEMGGVDLIFISSGIGHANDELDWSLELDTINTNVTGVTSLICASMSYFQTKGNGHLAVISSISALRGSSECPAYNASKSFISNYLEGMRCKVRKSNAKVFVTDIKPGFVDTKMAQGDGLFWVMPAPVAAQQIYKAIQKKKKVAYITKRWVLVAFLLKMLPKGIYEKSF
jgi:short-subunit dehydrogenase